MENKDMQELENLRSEMSVLKQMLKGQTIVSDRMMRRAMKGDYGKLRLDLIKGIIFQVVAMLLYVGLAPAIGLPMWFLIVTEVFFLVCLAATVYSLFHYMSDNLMTGNLTDVARRIVEYKRFNVRWLIFAIPVLVVWLVLFFYSLSTGSNADYIQDSFYGGIIGGVLGGIFGTIHYIKNLRRMNSILRQIDDVEAFDKE